MTCPACTSYPYDVDRAISAAGKNYRNAMAHIRQREAEGKTGVADPILDIAPHLIHQDASTRL